MRPLSAGNGAKQEQEQFRVNVNPCIPKQLKIILTTEEEMGLVPFRVNFFCLFYYFFVF